MTNFDTQLERVNRHFDLCCGGYDPIPLLDLAHSLRVVGEAKDELQSLLANRGVNKLKHARPTKKLKQLLRNKSFVMTLLPNMLDMKGISLGEIIIVNDFIGAADSSIMTPPSWPTRLLPILDWYRAEAVIWRGQEGGPIRSLSRERIVKRVANYLGASHPVKTNQTLPSVDDAAIKDFMKIEAADRPLPYYAVMSIAQEILRAAGLQAPKE